MEEAKEHTSSLDKLSKGNVFEVPSHYFDSLAKRIEERMLAGNTEFRKNIFEVPDHYFEQLEEKISASAYNKKTVFEVPDDYFEALENNLNRRIRPKGKVVEFEPFFSKNIQYGIAASIALLCVLGSIFYFQTRQNNLLVSKPMVELNTAAIIAKLDKNDAIKHLEYEEIELEDLIAFSTEDEKIKIKKDFEKELLTVKDKPTIESILEDIDLSALETEI